MADSWEAQIGLSPKETTDIPDKDRTTQLAQLDDLRAQATLKYSVKSYDAAAELYSQATELQAELNGEMSAQNADLLYAYGRCLYHCAVKNSDVLGPKVAGEKQEVPPSRPRGRKAATKDRMASLQVNGSSDDPKLADEEVITKPAEQEQSTVRSANTSNGESKPFFQFTGDENFDDPGDDDLDAGEVAQDGEGEDEDDDFGNAYEVLDLARVLLLKRLEEVQASEGKGKGTIQSPLIRQLQERLADTHDLQAEISLEGERFPNAVVDLRAALALKEELFPQESSLIAEAHYKLSLALEFSSVTQPTNENGEAGDAGEAIIDESMREDAAKEMEAAIASCKLRIQKEEEKVGATTAGSNADKEKTTQADIDDVKEMVLDMEQRLVELRQPPVSINEATGAGSVDGTNPLSGIRGSILGESATAQKARLDEASKGARDVTGLIRRKKGSGPASPQQFPSEPSMTGKRKIEKDEDIVNVGTSKRAKVFDEIDAPHDAR